ncbi:hypothetical protein LEMLEM_LOCUS3805 [Lemmus lemmus]
MALGASATPQLSNLKARSYQATWLLPRRRQLETGKLLKGSRLNCRSQSTSPFLPLLVQNRDVMSGASAAITTPWVQFETGNHGLRVMEQKGKGGSLCLFSQAALWGCPTNPGPPASEILLGKSMNK